MKGNGLLILVTGGTGFVGSHVVEGLVQQGHRVRCLMRNSSDDSRLAGLPVERIRCGGLGDRDGLLHACKGVDAVCHLAGATRALDAATYYQVNEVGTRALLEACTEASPDLRRFVYCSSIAASGPAGAAGIISEASLPRPVSHYGRSKLAAEEHVRFSSAHIPTVILRPAPVYGPRDRDILVFFRLVQRGFKVVPSPQPARVALIYVTDLVRLVQKVLFDNRAVGETYLACDGGAYDLDQVLDTMAVVLQRRALHVSIPAPILAAAAGAGGTWSHLTRRPALLSRDKLLEMTQPSWACDSGKAMAELDFACQVDLRTGLTLAARWYQEQGWL